MCSQPGEAMSFLTGLERKKPQVDSKEMETEFSMISAPKRSHTTSERNEKMALWRSILKRRDFLDYVCQHYLIQQQSRKKDPSPERPSSGRPMWKSISLCRIKRPSTLLHLKEEHGRPSISSHNSLSSNTKMTMTQVSSEISLKAQKQDIHLGLPVFRGQSWLQIQQVRNAQLSSLVGLL